MAAEAGSTPTEAARLLVTVVVPVYNEAAIFAESMNVLCDHLEKLADRYNCELLIVDDGSTDLTAELADTLASARPYVRVLRQPTNFDLGEATRRGIGASRGDWVVFFDCDLTYSPDHIDRMLDAAERNRAKVVIASPYMPGGRTVKVPFGRRIMSEWANRFLGLTAQKKLHTITGLVRCYDGRFLRSLDIKAEHADVNTEIIYKAQVLRARIVEVPATLDWSAIERRRAVPTPTSRLAWVTAKSLVSGFLFRPFMFFFLPGTLLGLAALALLGWCCALWAGSPTGLEHAVTTQPAVFALTAITGIVSLQLLSVCMLTLQSKRYYDELFHLGTTLLRRLRREDEQALLDDRQPGAVGRR